MARAKTDDERRRKNLDDIVAFTLKLPEVVESVSWNRPALKRGKHLIFLLRDPEHLSMMCSFEARAALLRDHPETFYVTDHYLNYPACLVRLLGADLKALRAAVKKTWERAGEKARKKSVPLKRPSARRR
jgi:hypothetical protein